MNSNKSNILWGLFFIFLGIGFAGNAFNLWNFSIFFRGWWTLFIIIPCLVSITQNGPKTGSIVGLIIGVLLLLSRRGIIDGAIIGKLMFPSILVVIGISIIVNNFSRNKIPQSDYDYNSNFNYTSGSINRDNKNLTYYTATFASRSDNCDNQIFEGANVNAIFGSVCLHLENAIINENVVIHCNATFGGIELFLPGYVNVKVSSTPIFGGVTNRRRGVTNTDTPTVYINATSMFGGVEIR